MFEKGIHSNTRKVLEEIKDLIKKEDFYLAGGTGLSLLLGHRESIDLDFFKVERFGEDMLEKSLAGINVSMKRECTLVGVKDGVNLSFMSYPYPLIENTLEFSGIKVASILDIALMKLSAVSKRGARKDFIDLYFIIKDHLPLLGLINQFEKKFPNSENLIPHIIMSLSYFEDADKEADPVMFIDIKWGDIKTFFINESKQVMEQLTLPHNL